LPMSAVVPRLHKDEQGSLTSPRRWAMTRRHLDAVDVREDDHGAAETIR